MALVGIIVVFLGFLLSMFSVGLTTSMTGRLVLVLVGIAVSLFGIIGLLNRAYLSKALWRKM
jgi:hypothetical protein